MKFKVFFYDGLDYSTGEFYSAQEAFSENFIEFKDNKLVSVDKCSIVLLYTGLKDDNGIEIYDGNVIEFLYNGERLKAKVSYDFNKAQFGLSGDGYFFSFAWLHSVEIGYKIIGNIYENPELVSTSNSN